MPACSSCGSESAELMEMEGGTLCCECVKAKLAESDYRAGLFNEIPSRLPGYDYLDGKKYHGFERDIGGQLRT